MEMQQVLQHKKNIQNLTYGAKYSFRPIYYY